MHDGEHADPPRRWLADDLRVLNTLLLAAASALAIALTSWLWHHIHPARTVPPIAHQQQPLVAPSSEPKDRKSTRSKDRRRRGRDPFRDLLKGGRKSRALLRALKADDDDNPPPPSPTAPGNDTVSSISRSPSPEPADTDRRAPHLDGESDDGIALNSNISADISDHGSSDACSRADAIRPRSVPPDSMTSADAQLNVSSASTIIGHPDDAPSSPPVSTACADACTPQPRNSQAASTSGNYANLVRARTRMRLSRIEQNVGSPPMLFTPSTLSDSVATHLPSIPSNVSCPSPSVIQFTGHFTDGAGPSTPTTSRSSTPLSRSSSPPGQEERCEQPLDQIAAGAELQLASMHSALEAARVREEQLHVEVEQASKERDELRWRWNEDAGLWRRREAELQAQIYHLMQQLQTYAAIAFRAQQASNSGFSSPTSPHTHSSPLMQHHPLVPFPLPPPIQPQNSASAPAHVQAMLASSPVFMSHPPGSFTPGFTGVYSGTDHGVSPLVWSGLGLCVPKRDPRQGGRRTPDSSASGSSSRGPRRRTENVRSASDESSPGDWDGMDDGSEEDLWEEEEEEEDIFRNNVLADAILKRPESIRGWRGSIGKRSGRGRTANGGRGESMDALKDPTLETPGVVPPQVETPAVTSVAVVDSNSTGHEQAITAYPH